MTPSEDRTVTIELLHVPDCPLLDRIRDTLSACLPLAETPVRIQEREGDYPSPTLLINGVDIASGAPLHQGPAAASTFPPVTRSSPPVPTPLTCEVPNQLSKPIYISTNTVLSCFLVQGGCRGSALFADEVLHTMTQSHVANDIATTFQMRLRQP